ncbi:hypothetical protein FEP63_03875 [Burkholderia multivorans]|nr:hypothetical protein [Burkholderia multivorans]MDR8881123.1 hypothetical protein [Burkholderia multivorans]MDR8888215.1 hypothetical protein [Burkholderia multivorans]MDR8893068.1 hypothetical protein [Burkholderia multivorans]MDR8900612.1 hypothetical protein [Burkholderia multivorans]
MLQTVKKGSSLHADARSTARIAEAACEPKSRMRANARRARDGAARLSRRACGVGLERDGGTRYRHREGRGLKAESETEGVRAKTDRMKDGTARLSRLASCAALERDGRHAVSRAGRTGIQRGNRKRKECARARTPDEVRPGEVESSRIRRRARAPRASRAVASRKDGDGKRNRNRKECARGTRYGPARLRRRASGVGLERHGRHAVSRAGRTGIQRGNRKRKQCARARRARYGPARLSHLASGVALRRDGRDAVSRAGRTGL